MLSGRVEDGAYSAFVLQDKTQDVKWTLGSSDTAVIQSWIDAIDEAKALYGRQSTDGCRKIWVGYIIQTK